MYRIPASRKRKDEYENRNMEPLRGEISEILFFRHLIEGGEERKP